VSGISVPLCPLWLKGFGVGLPFNFGNLSRRAVDSGDYGNLSRRAVDFGNLILWPASSPVFMRLVAVLQPPRNLLDHRPILHLQVTPTLVCYLKPT
jgi:hypothetical protein